MKSGLSGPRGVLLAGLLTKVGDAHDDRLTAQHTWLLVGTFTVGYMISRGLAKSGSREPYTPAPRGAGLQAVRQREVHRQLGATVRRLAVVEAMGDAADEGKAETEAGRVVTRCHAAPVVAHDDLDLRIVTDRDRTRYMMVTFDGTQYAEPALGSGTHGDFLVMSAPETRRGREF